MQRMLVQISRNTAPAGTDAGGITTARKGTPRKRVLAPCLLGTRMVVENQRRWHEAAIFDITPILEGVCCHITHRLLLELGVHFVGDDNDIR
jgi:hypothetical protein